MMMNAFSLPQFVRSTRRQKLALVALCGLLGLSGCGHHFHHPRPVTPVGGDRIAILSHVEQGAHIDPSIASIAVAVPPAIENDAWAQPGGAANKSYGNLALGDKPDDVWSVTISGSTDRKRLAAAPVIGGGRMFVMDVMGVLHVYDAATGQPVWTHDFAAAGVDEEAVFGGGATYDNGKVFVDTGLGYVAALDAQTGKLLWQKKPSGPLRGSPTVAYNSVFIVTQNNEIYALKADDGTTIWQETASLGQAGIFGVAAPSVGQGTVIAGFSTGELIAYRYENGRTLWSDALARTSLSTSVGVLTDVDADPIIDRGRVYALGAGGRMAAYEMVTGQRIWELNVAGISTPAVAGDWLFALTDDDRLLCIERASGKVRWIANLPRYHKEKKKSGPIFWTGPVLAGDRLWVGNSEGNLYSVALADGSFKQFARLHSSITLAPVVAKSTLYVLDDSGKITAFR